MSTKSNCTSLRYKLLLFLLSPVVFGYIVYRTFKDGGRNYFSQRLGFNYPSILSEPILIHCASVGEFNAAKPLIQELNKQYPNTSLVISTNTPTAAQLVSKLQLNNVSHVYLPLDYSATVNAFLKKINPKCILVLETEIWPNLFLSAAQNKIPLTIINGRLTKKSIKASAMIKQDYEAALKMLTAVLARSDLDRSKFIGIGAHEKTTHTAGNLKYATAFMSSTNLACTTIKRPFVLAVSTHDDEEQQLAQHITVLKKKNYLLVIAPRYPERCKKLQQQFQQEKINVALRSNQNAAADDSDIYIIDTLGELEMYLNEAALVFVGGSLIPRGGHNILEPAIFGKCTIVGPHTDNFALETKELLEAKGIVQIKDTHDLGVKFVQLLNNDRERIQYGLNARKLIEKKSAVLKNYFKFLEPIIKNTTS